MAGFATSASTDIVYHGSQDEDLQGIIKDFTADYAFQMFSVQTNKTNDPYVDSLNAQRHMCHSFLNRCKDRARSVAQHVLQHMTEQEIDRHSANRRRGVKSTPPTDFFDRFVRQMKTSLGPQDALVHWVLAAEEVVLQQLSGQGLDEFIGDLTLYLQRIVRAQADCAEHLRTAAATGSGMASAQSPAATPYDIHALEQVSRQDVGLAGLLESSGKLRKPRERPQERGQLVRTLDSEFASQPAPSPSPRALTDAGATAALAARSARLVEAANEELERREVKLGEAEQENARLERALFSMRHARERQAIELDDRDRLIRRLHEQGARERTSPPSPTSSASGEEEPSAEYKQEAPAIGLANGEAVDAPPWGTEAGGAEDDP